MAERPPSQNKGEGGGLRRGAGSPGPAGGGAGAADAQKRPSQLAFTVLPTSDDYGRSAPSPSLSSHRQEARRWRALAIAAFAVAILALGLLAASATLGRALPLPPSSPRAAAQPQQSRRSSSSSADATALLPGGAADELVQELGLNATQALLLDASRLRAFLGSRAWREQKAAAAAAKTSGGGGNNNNGDNDKSRGIVIPAGGRDHLLNALVTVRYLRRIGCRLPIEVVHFGPEEIGGSAGDKGETNEQDEGKRREASSARKAAAALALEPGVSLVDASAASSPGAQAQNLAHHRPAEPTSFGRKVWAAAYSASFREILLLDGDSLPLLDPSPLFEAPDYKRAGSMFWPDYWHDAWTDKALWRALGVVPPWQRDEYGDDDKKQQEGEGDADGGDEDERRKSGGGGGGRGGRRWRHRLVESGQLLLDRGRHADVLEWAWMLNGPNREVVYKAMHGDKDTWRLAFDLAGKSGGGYERQGGREKGLWSGGGDNGDDNGGDDNGGDGNGGDGNGGGWFHLMPHMARDVVREGPPDHKHRWHHVAALQAAPRGAPFVLEAARSAALARARGGGGGGGVPSALKQRAARAFERAVAEAREVAAAAAAGGDDDGPTGEAGDGGSGGWPLFLHRTSFNAKFFPDCARRPEEDEAGAAAAAANAPGKDGVSGSSKNSSALAYCRPTHSSVPLADEQAARALKPHMYAFDDEQVDTGRAARCFSRLASSGGGEEEGGGGGAPLPPSSVALLLGAALPEARCAPEGLGERGTLPVPALEIDAAWPYVARAIDASMDVYWQVRRAFWE